MNGTTLNKDNVLLVPLTLTHKIGLNEAITLQQVHYWLNPKLNKNIYDGCYWVHNTYDEWQQQFPFWQTRTIRRIFKGLEEKNLIRSFVKKSLKNSKHYTINYETLNKYAKTGQSLANCEILNTQNTCVVKKDTKIAKSVTQVAKTGTHVAKSVSCVDKFATKCGQNGQQGGQKVYDQSDKLAGSYKDTETTQRILPPPLTPPPNNKIGHLVQTDRKEEGIYQNLIKVWHQHVQSNLEVETQTIRLTKDRYLKLQKLFGTIFDNDPEKWEAYCSQISSCRFLMGESPSGFKISLDWALNEANALKVLEGKIYDKTDTFKEKTWAEFEKELQMHCQKNNLPDTWFEVCKLIAKRCGQAVFVSWFKDMLLKLFTPTTVSVSVKSPFIKDYITTHYFRDFERALKNVLPKLTTIDIHVGGSNAKT